MLGKLSNYQIWSYRKQLIGNHPMNPPDLQSVANVILSRAKRQGYILPREIRMELKEAGHSITLWKQVVGLIRPSVKYRHGRYYFDSPGFSRLQLEQKQLRMVKETLDWLIGSQQEAEEPEDRRKEERAAFVRHVRVLTEDEQELTVVSQDLSSSGIRLVTDRSLLGRKIHLSLPRPNDKESPIVIAARILWSFAIADGLYKNGGAFLELISPQPT